MGETRNRGSVGVNAVGEQSLKDAKAEKRWAYWKIAQEAKVGEKTVQRFFKRESVDYDSAFAIAQALGLKLEDLIDLPETPEPEIETALDWRKIGEAEFQKQLEINQRRRQATATATELGIHVPLGLVERKQQTRSQSRDFSPEMGMEAYQPPSEVVEKTYQHQQFLDEIIGGVGKAEKKGVAIIGEPGAGKTTLLEQIGRYLQEKDALPIFIPLTNLGEKSLKEYLLTQWGERNITPSQLEELLQTQRVWFLLDGVDEMAQASPLETVYRQAVELQQARVVLSCRLNVWDASTKNLPNFQTFKTLEFSEEQVREFIHQWFGEEPLWERLKESGKERLRDLVKNPLRLSLLCQTWEYEKELPETQAALYERFVRYFYDWKPQEFPVTLTQREELNAALARLAREAIDKGKTRFRIGQRFALRVMGEEWLNLGCCLGWLNQVDRDKDTEEAFYAFYHPTFQEYFAALAVEDWSFFLTHVPENPQQGVYRIFEPQWKQVILLWLGRGEVEAEEEEEFIRKLIEFEDGCEEFYYYQAYFLAAAGIAEFKTCTKADQIVQKIVKWGFGYFNIEKQKWITFLDPIEEGARSTLPQTIRTKAISELIQLLNTCSDENIRCRTAESLGKIAVGNETAIAALIQLLATTESESSWWKAAPSLGEIAIGNKTAIAALVQLLAPTESEDVRRRAAHSLGEIAVGNEMAIAALVQLLATTESEEIRWRAADILGKIDVGNESAIAALVQLLVTPESKNFWGNAADSLGEIAVGNEMAIAALVQLLATTESEGIRWWAADILGKIDVGNESAIAALVQLLAPTEFEKTWWRAAHSLGKIAVGNEMAIAALVQLLAPTESEWIRWWAARSLGKIDVGNESAIAASVQLLVTPESENIRWSAAHSLGEIAVGNEMAIAALVQLLATTESESIRWKAADSLGEIAVGNEMAIAALVQLLATTESKEIRGSAAHSLRKIDAGNKTAIAASVQLLAITESEGIPGTPYYTLEKASVLREIDAGNETAIAALVQLLATTESESIRWRAADSLGEIDAGNETAIAALVQLLATAESEDIRSNAAKSLGKIAVGDESAIAALAQLLTTTESKKIWWNAAESLEKVLVTKEHYAGVVLTLKDCLADEVYENNFDRFKKCYEVIWHCAQNLSYPDFYQAWHHPTLTPHPELQETTGVGATPEALLLNWDNFPQNLARALKQQPELADRISVTCIDASQFLNPDNPASEIYAKLVKAGYPRCPDGTPRDLQSLKVYCELECPEAYLIFYEAPSNPPPQGFSPAFLNALSRFAPANRIAILSEETNISLQTFSPTQPNLLEAILGWLRQITLEA